MTTDRAITRYILRDTREQTFSTSRYFLCRYNIGTVYILFVLGLLVGAFSADSLSDLIGLDRSWGMALFTIAGAGAAVLLMRFIANRMALQEGFTPIVKRIVRAAREPANLI